MNEYSEFTAYFRVTRLAQKRYQNTTIAKRVEIIKNLQQNIINNLDSIIESLVKETGKVRGDVLLNEIIAVLEILNYYQKHAEKILKPQKRKASFPLFFNKKAWVEYHPLGVVLVIAPWNYPFQLALVPVISALISGNAVILKPSELTPQSGELIKNLLVQSGLDEDLLQVVQGDGAVGSSLIEEKPDKIFFTGSVETGKKIMTQAGKNLIPVELELGGKDPMIVFADADLERASSAAIFGAFINAGQICVSVERLYLEAQIKDQFMELLQAKASKMRIGHELGKIINKNQLEKIKAQLKNSDYQLSWIGAGKEEDLYLASKIITVEDNFTEIMQEETFGPVLAVMTFNGEKEALKLANETKYGLNASVWSSDIIKAKNIASQIITGNCFINNVITNIGNPDLPFGGVKQSGIGKYHGEAGLKSFARETSIMLEKGTNAEFFWFPFPDNLEQIIKDLIDFRYKKNVSIKERFKKIRQVLKARKVQ